MATTSYDNRSTVSGSVSNPTQTTTGTSGDWGSLTSVGHPRPYVSGGAFKSQRNTASDGFASGVVNPGLPFARTYSSYRWVTATHPGILPPTGLTAADVLSRSNPSQPIVDVPVFLFELREVPELFKLAGETVAKKVASGNLSYQFGWKPLLNDLGNLLGLQASVDKRVAELSRLHAKGGRTAKGDVGTSSLNGNEQLVGFPPGGGTTCYVTYKGTCKRWISVSWVPSYDPRTEMPDLNKIRHDAFRSVLGLTIDPSTVWNALPWSWLVDWFTNLGSILASRRNLVGFVPGQCYVMTHTTLESKYRLTGSGPLSITLPRYFSETKERTGTSGVMPTAYMPFLSGRQLGILASLAVQRR